MDFCDIYACFGIKAGKLIYNLFSKTGGSPWQQILLFSRVLHSWIWAYISSEKNRAVPHILSVPRSGIIIYFIISCAAAAL